MRKLLIYCLLFMLYSTAYSQEKIKGVVFEDDNEHLHPLPGANVYWLGTTTGTVTDSEGKFKISMSGQKDPKLVVSFVGYVSDTIRIIPGQNNINIALRPGSKLNEVRVEARKEGEYIDKLKPIQTEVITTSGLERLACCNLSESFENSGTVDVAYTDAVTGAKQIQMLGLASIYSQILSENVPMLSGLSLPFGLSYVPGPWMESIQVSKGTASVINGYSSLSGQINVEYRKPAHSDPFYLNLYTSDLGKVEANAHYATKVSERWSTMTMAHFSDLSQKIDKNDDSFLDVPMVRQFNVLHRWNYDVEGKICNQYMVKLLKEDRTGGQVNFSPDQEMATYYGVPISTIRAEIVAKHGFHMKKPGTSLGIITSGSYHDHKSSFGLNHYNALQKNVYLNGIFQTFLGTTDHQISTGVGLTYDDYAEDLSIFDLDTVFNTSEITTGIFGQYTYSYMKRLTLVAGIRADYHNLYGILITPRTHLKFDFSEHTILRLSAGRGIRSPRLIAENLGYMVSSRRWVIPVEENYEAGWNVGGNLTHDIALGNERKVTFSIDFYRTWFTKQWVIDTETDPSAVLIRPLSGESWSNSFQFNVLADIGKYFDLSLAGRYNDVRQTIYGKLEQKAFSTPLKGLLTLSFNSKHEKWSVDLTSQWHGKAVIPDYYESLEHFDQPDDYFIFHLQLTRRFKNWDIYTGCENILDFMQHKPVLGHNDPFGSHFDASAIWGPIMGRMFYAGMRYNLKSKK